jgi:glycolate oxidase FAD binding subunit
MSAALGQAAQAVDETAIEALVEAVREAGAAVRQGGAPLALRGAGSKAWYGNRVEGRMLDLRGNVGIVDYEPSELVLVARAGTPLVEIEKLLASERQMLAFEPPRFASIAAGPASDIGARMSSAALGATLGGAIAAGLSGPRRMAAGSARDFVLGTRLIDGRGQHLSFGGRVMKNVAGYDVSRALAGSLGTLGIITEVSLKVLPLPAASLTLAFSYDEHAAIEQMNAWAGKPLPITASAWSTQLTERDFSDRGELVVRLEGSEAAVQSAIRQLGGVELDVDEAAAFWASLREQTHRYFATRPVDLPQWRLSLPSTSMPLDAKRLDFADQLIEWGGAQRWIAAGAEAGVVRDAAISFGGHATAWRATDELKARHGAFTPLAAPLAQIHRRLKTEFDPLGLFNRGRMYADL